MSAGLKARAVIVAALASLFGISALATRAPEARWYKGNTHTHTLWSDGDAPPEVSADWYKSKGYHFLVFSEHNVLAEGEKWVRLGEGKRDFKPQRVKPLVEAFGADWVRLREKGGERELRLKTLDELKNRFEEPGKFLLIPGEEITEKKLNVHHNSVNHVNLIPAPEGKTAREVMQKTLAAVKAEAEKSGKPVLVHLNHPNWKWAVSPDDVAHVLEERYFEVYNGARDSDNYGDAVHMGLEPMWDYVLTLRLGKLGGDVLYALATDDTHEYYKEQAVSSPGRGWVMVRSESLAPDAITRAMLAGDFYASSGVTLEDVKATKEDLTVKVAAEAGVTYTVRFIGTRLEKKSPGKPGEILQETKGAEASYRFKGDELYVRATVISSRKHPNPYAKDDPEMAWVQPVVVRRP